MFKLSMGYPDIKSQVEILRDRHRSDPLDDVKAVCSANDLVQTIDVVRQTFICDEVYEYIAELAEQTRHHESVQFGISPRGALAVSRAAKHMLIFPAVTMLRRTMLPQFSAMYVHTDLF